MVEIGQEWLRGRGGVTRSEAINARLTERPQSSCLLGSKS
jgi:hypothetical protein